MDCYFQSNLGRYTDNRSTVAEECLYAVTESCSSSDSGRSCADSMHYVPRSFSGGVHGCSDRGGNTFNSGATFGSIESQTSVEDSGDNFMMADDYDYSLPSPPYGYTIFANNFQGAVADVKSKLRNESVSSPTPQQVSWKVAPFTQHFSSTGGWGLLPWENSNGARRKGSASNRRQSCSGGGCCRCDSCENNRDARQRVCGGDAYDVAENRGVELSNNGPRFHRDWERAACNCRPRPRPRLSTTCEDPHRELLNNGREVAIDAVDLLQMRLRGGARQLSQGDDSAAVGSSLKRRLAQIRAAIREQLADQDALAAAQGRPYCCSSRRKGKHRSKKCKFCLSKKEDEDIVTSHNLHDAQGLVTCPILQQYECELCHATGRQAHTIKYCPLNNPDTPHDLILGARLKVMIRNRYGH